MSNNNKTLNYMYFYLYITYYFRGVTKINIILMQNLNIIDRKFVNRIFDLKGSHVDRKTKNIYKVDKMQALKDQDLLWMKPLHNGVSLIFIYTQTNYL